MKPDFRTYPMPTAEQVQDEVFRTFGSAGDLVVTKRERVAVAVTETKRAHGLGRVPADIIIGPPNLNTTVWRPRNPDSKYYYLQAATACTVSVWLL